MDVIELHWNCELLSIALDIFATTTHQYQLSSPPPPLLVLYRS